MPRFRRRRHRLDNSGDQALWRFQLVQRQSTPSPAAPGEHAGGGACGAKLNMRLGFALA
ncbi:hypothetical protein V6Z12_D10G128900 [Gossypium hirsutum]